VDEKKKHVYKVEKYRNLNVLIDKTVETRLKIVSHHVSKCKKKMDVYSSTKLPSIKKKKHLYIKIAMLIKIRK